MSCVGAKIDETSSGVGVDEFASANKFFFIENNFSKKICNIMQIMCTYNITSVWNSYVLYIIIILSCTYTESSIIYIDTMKLPYKELPFNNIHYLTKYVWEQNVFVERNRKFSIIVRIFVCVAYIIRDFVIWKFIVIYIYT